MTRSLIFSLFVFALVSCQKEETPAPQTPAATQPTSPLSPPEGTSTKAPAEGAQAEIKKATASATEAAQPVPASASELKQKIGVYKVDQLKAMAEQIAGEITKNDTLVKSLNDQIAKAGIDPAKLAELKKSLETAGSSLKDSKDKLQLVVDKLKEGNVDVSKYTSLLGSK
ncbi:MAG: hypothetical protein HY717_22975 [Planctomycetes bacterium]|nr:hypothetical protein [Planctomycetota bacterium]